MLLGSGAGMAEGDGGGRGKDLWSDPTLSPLVSLQWGCHAPGPGEMEELGGQAIRVRSDPAQALGEGVLSHVPCLQSCSPHLHVPCSSSFSFLLWLGLLGVAVFPGSIPER